MREIKLHAKTANGSSILGRYAENWVFKVSKAFESLSAFPTAGLPSLAMKTGSYPELITHKETGFLFEQENAMELAGHLVRLVKNQRLRNDISVRALQRARVFNIKAYADKVFECYRTLLDENSVSN